MIDILKLYRDYRIEYRDHGHKHCRSGWVQIECPFCSGNAGFHLGYCVDSRSKFAGVFVCWRCGGHHEQKVLKEILKDHKPRHDHKEILKQYRISGFAGPSVDTQLKLVKTSFKYPSGTDIMQDHHRRYLLKRNFDPDYIESEWGVLGTGPISSLSVGRGKEKKYIDYRNRIIIPIEWDGKIVSFQGRDITNRHKMKYLACPEEREIINLKTILYGKSNGKRGVLVEGVTDVWRLGFGSLSTFGIKYTLKQIKCLSKFEMVFILFDPEEQAQQQAEKIEAALNFRGVKTKILTDITTDPGEMKQDDADLLMEDLGL